MNVKLALWGAGGIAKKFALAVKANQSFELVGVASRTYDHAERTAIELGIKAYKSYDHLLADDSIDCVYISTPTKNHYNDMKRVISHRKSIICEKPFTETEEEAVEVFRLADEEKVIIVDGLWSMYMPLFKYITQQSKKMGKLYFSSASLGWPSIVNDNNCLSSKYEIWDYEVYPIAIMTHLFGAPKSVNSKSKMVKNLICENIAYFKFSNGGIGRVHSSLLHRSSYLFIAVYSKGIIISRKWWMGDQRVVVLRFIDTPIIKQFSHSVNGYEYEVKELENRYNKITEINVPRSTTLTILEVLDRVKRGST